MSLSNRVRKLLLPRAAREYYPLLLCSEEKALPKVAAFQSIRVHRFSRQCHIVTGMNTPPIAKMTDDAGAARKLSYVEPNGPELGFEEVGAE